MSISDVVELESILQGDDHDAVELERNLITLDATIDQQERRLQYEDDQRRMFQEYQGKLASRAVTVNHTLDTLNEMIVNMLQAKDIDNNLAAFLLRVADYELSRNSLLDAIHNIMLILGDEDEVFEDGNKIQEDLNNHDSAQLQAEYENLMSKEDALMNDVEASNQDIEHETASIDQLADNSDATKLKIKGFINEKHSIQLSREHLTEEAAMIADEYVANLRSISDKQVRIQENVDVINQERGTSEASLRELDDTIDTLTDRLNGLEAGNESDDKFASQLATEIMMDVKQLASLNGKLNQEKEAIIAAKSHAAEVFNLLNREGLRHIALVQRNDGYSKEIEQVTGELDTLVQFLRATRENIHMLQAKLGGQHESTAEVLRDLEASTARKANLLSQVSFKRNENMAMTQYIKETEDAIGQSNRATASAKDKAADIVTENQAISCTITSLNQSIIESGDIELLQVEVEKAKNDISDMLLQREDLQRKIQSSRKSLDERKNLAKETESKRTNAVAKQKTAAMRSTKDSRLKSSRETIMQQHKLALQKIRDDLLERDKEFKDSYYQAESTLEETERSVLKELADIRHQIDEETKAAPHTQPSTSTSSTSKVTHRDDIGTVAKQVPVEQVAALPVPDSSSESVRTRSHPSVSTSTSSSSSTSTASTSVSSIHNKPTSPRATLQRQKPESRPLVSQSMEPSSSADANASESQDSLRRKRKYTAGMGLGSLLSETEPSTRPTSNRDVNAENIPTQPRVQSQPQPRADVDHDDDAFYPPRFPTMASAFMTPQKTYEGNAAKRAALGERKQGGAKMVRK